MKKAIAIGLGVVLAGVAGGAAIVQLGLDRRPTPNVLVIVWDTVRADRLTVYGHDKPTTPRMAEWAHGGVVFEQAISPAMWTVPAHASMFTGLMPTSHGAGYDWRWLDHHNLTLAEWFQQNGYATYAFSANPNLSPGRVNLLQGFESIDLSWGKKWQRKVAANTRRKLLRRDRSTEISPAFKGGASSTFSYNAGPITQEAFVDWLELREEPEKPWLAYLNYMEAHKPRVPALPSRKRVAADEVIKTGLRTDLTMKSQLLYSYDLKSYTEEELEAIDAVYEASLVDLDEATGDLLDDLQARGYLDNTIVVFTSDHGELLGEHQLFGHRHSVYQELVHVPLVISYPGVLDPKRVKEPVSNLNLYSTLCELAGIELPEKEMARGSLVGAARNLAQQVFSESISVDRLGWQKVKRWAPGNLDEDPRDKRFQTVIEGDWKLIAADDGVTELYHLAEDPAEEHDLASSDSSKVAELREKIDAWTKSVPAYDPSKRTGEDEPNVDSDEMKKQLEMLGYLSDDEEPEDEEAPPEDDTDAALDGVE